MHNVIGDIQNQIMQRLSAAAPSAVVRAIKSAADDSGVDFSYLLQQANAESSFDPEAQAKTSSASGLFQFIESTWMNMVDRYGEGLGIDTSQDKQALLDLRSDPDIASEMAAKFADENETVLQRNWGGDVGATELYFAHFLGAGSASAFLNARDENPMADAAALFPKAASANENVFYDRQTGKSKSLEDVYAYFDKKFSLSNEDLSADQTPIASAIPAPLASPLTAHTLILAQNDGDELYDHGPLNLDERAQDNVTTDQEDTVQIAMQMALAQENDALDLLSNQQTGAFGYQRTNTPSSLHNMIYKQLELLLMTQSDLPFLGQHDKKLL